MAGQSCLSWSIPVCSALQRKEPVCAGPLLSEMHYVTIPTAQISLWMKSCTPSPAEAATPPPGPLLETTPPPQAFFLTIQHCHMQGGGYHTQVATALFPVVSRAVFSPSVCPLEPVPAHCLAAVPP